MRDAEYFAEREKVERKLAAKATNNNLREIHLGFAERYSGMAAAKRHARQGNSKATMTSPETRTPTS
jgi:hypothetical protein